MKYPKHITVATAESITGGRLQAHFTSKSGSSAYFMGGICAYSLEAKVNHLGVDRALAEGTNCVHADVAKQMAIGCQKMFGTDLAIATTGYETTYIVDGDEKQAVAHVAVLFKGDIHVTAIPPTGNSREDRLDHVTNEALRFAINIVSSSK